MGPFSCPLSVSPLLAALSVTLKVTVCFFSTDVVKCSFMWVIY